MSTIPSHGWFIITVLRSRYLHVFPTTVLGSPPPRFHHGTAGTAHGRVNGPAPGGRNAGRQEQPAAHESTELRELME